MCASNSDGESRRFGFLGFKTAEEAKKVVEFFNNTYMDTSKISVEVAKPVCKYAAVSRPRLVIPTSPDHGPSTQ